MASGGLKTEARQYCESREINNPLCRALEPSPHLSFNPLSRSERRRKHVIVSQIEERKATVNPLRGQDGQAEGEKKGAIPKRAK